MTKVVFETIAKNRMDTEVKEVSNKIWDTIEDDFGNDVQLTKRPGKMIVTFNDSIDYSEVEDYLKELYEDIAGEYGGFGGGSYEEMVEWVWEDEKADADKFFALFRSEPKFPFYFIDEGEIGFWIEA